MDGYPQCPNKRHKNSRVTRAGMEGPKDGPKRQRWWCEPKTGPRHRFRETLPRIVGHAAEGHTCPECASSLEPWEGQPAPRLYGYSVRDIAWALARVSEGKPYRSVAAEVRKRAGRELDDQRRKDPKTKKWLAAANDHGQLVSDWVDVYAPVIWAAYAPTAWPEKVILDEDEMRYSRPGSARGELAFWVLAVFGYTPKGHPYVASIEAVPSRTKLAWQRHLRRLDGAPRVALSDGGSQVIGGMAHTWTSTELRRCEFHLTRNIRDSLPADIVRNPEDTLLAKVSGAVASAKGWDAFRKELTKRSAAEPSRFNATWALVTRLEPTVLGQLPTRNPMGPNSTGPLEQFFRELDRHVGDRSAKMTNKRRADALLMLLAARYNRWGNEQAWAELLRQHLTRAKGVAGEQRLHTDLRTNPSLRK